MAKVYVHDLEADEENARRMYLGGRPSDHVRYLHDDDADSIEAEAMELFGYAGDVVAYKWANGALHILLG